MMSRHGHWLAAVVLLLGAPGCLGGADEVGSSEQALTLEEVEASGAFGAIAAELQAGDCLDAAHIATSLGHEIVWAGLGGLSDLALLEIDGVVSCSAPTVSLSAGERSHLIMLRPMRASRPDPEPANPDESRPDPEPANPDESRPDPEPARPDASRVSGTTTAPDQNRPDPEPATGTPSTSTVKAH